MTGAAAARSWPEASTRGFVVGLGLERQELFSRLDCRRLLISIGSARKLDFYVIGQPAKAADRGLAGPHGVRAVAGLANPLKLLAHPAILSASHGCKLDPPGSRQTPETRTVPNRRKR